jgi:adenylate cyclase class IV
MRNVEIKAKVHDMAGFRTLASQLSGTGGEHLVQEDTFFGR